MATVAINFLYSYRTLGYLQPHMHSIVVAQLTAARPMPPILKGTASSAEKRPRTRHRHHQ